MTKTSNSPFGYACTWCSAAPEQPCTQPSGAKVTKVRATGYACHTARWATAYNAHYEQGVRRAAAEYDKAMRGHLTLEERCASTTRPAPKKHTHG